MKPPVNGFFSNSSSITKNKRGGQGTQSPPAQACEFVELENHKADCQST